MDLFNSYKVFGLIIILILPIGIIVEIGYLFIRLFEE